MIVVLFIFLLLPFLVNLYEGVLKRPKNSTVYKISNESFSNDVEPYVDDLIHLIESKGTVLGTNNPHVEGYKITRGEILNNDQELFNIIQNNIPEIENFCSNLIGKNLQMADCNQEQYCWFLRLYNKDGHYLDWHFDNNFTDGFRYTYVLNLYVSECNTSSFMTKDMKNKVSVFKSKTGEGVFYDGSNIKHSISKQTKQCVRISLIIPLYENPHMNWFGKLRKKVRNVTDILVGL